MRSATRRVDLLLGRTPAAAEVDAAVASGHPTASRVNHWMRASLGIA